MCGIAAIISLGTPVDERDVAAAADMVRRIRHRGPDQTGYDHDDRVALANARLRIIDTSTRGDLPMKNGDGNVRLAYNGEITNFRELAQRFGLHDKYGFRSGTDTEVLLHLYEDMGISLLDHLTGMFAFVLYDRAAGKVFVVRDFFGLRPLFFMEAGDRLYIASEIKAFLGLPRFRPDIDFEAIHDFLTLAYIPGERTPFRQIRELRGGEMIEVDLRTSAARRRVYFRPRYAPDAAIDEATAVTEVRRRMIDAVRRNLIADAPLGLTLSGGVDTSSILAMAALQKPPEEIHTFSIAMDEPSFDESRYQRAAVAHIRPTHHEIRVTPRMVLDELVRTNAFMDEPSGDGAAIPSFILARHAGRYVRSLLSGEGGDEMFNAYETHLAWKARRQYRLWTTPAMRRAIRSVAGRLPVSYRKLSFDFLFRRFSEGAEKDTARAHVHWRHAFSEDEKQRLMPACAEFEPTDDGFARRFAGYDFDDELDRISALDIETFFIDDLMVKNDRTFMAHAIEARFPLMDKALFDFVSTIPSELRIKGWTRRYIEKQAMRPFLPRATFRRGNFGLEMPHAIWFRSEFREAAERYFSREHVERTGFLRHEPVAEFWRLHLEGRRDYGRPLWCLLNLLVWFDLYVADGDHERYREGVESSAATSASA